MKLPWKNEQGAASVELALLIPFFLLVMWFGSAASYFFRLENNVHRATASLADIVANMHLDEGEELAGRIGSRMPLLLQMMRNMINADESEAQMGLRISHYKTKVPDSVHEPDPPSVFEAGLPCPNTLPPLDQLAAEGGGDMTTADNVAKSTFVRVESCYEDLERWNLNNWVFPKTFASDFTTLRKSWE
jgi:hypothetical protein